MNNANFNLKMMRRGVRLGACFVACVVLMLASSALAAPYPAANGSHYFTDSSTLGGGTALRSKLVASGDSLYLKIFANYDTPALTVATYGLMFEWDPTALRLDETWPIAPRGATLDAGIGAGDGTRVWSTDTGTGRYAAEITFSAGFPSGNLDTCYYIVRFTKLNALTTTINLIPDTDPSEIQFLTKGGCGFVNSTGLFYVQPNPSKMYNIQIYSQEPAVPTFANATLNPMVQNQACSVTNVVVYDSSAALGMRSCTLWVTAGTIPVAWRPISLTASTDSTLTHDTVVSFYGTIPADSLAAPRIYYFFAATDTWGNTGFSKVGVNYTDTTNADSAVVYSNVPLTLQVISSRGIDSLPATVKYATSRDSVYITLTTAADSVHIQNRSMGGFDDTEAVFSNTGGTNATTTLYCTAPLVAGYNYIAITGIDGVMPRSTDTITVIYDTSVPSMTGLLLNNGATVTGAGCTIWMTATDTPATGSGVETFVIDIRNAPTGFGLPDYSVRVSQLLGDSYAVLFTLDQISDSRFVYVYVAAQDSAGNLDTASAWMRSIKVDTDAPRVFDENLTAFTLPSDSQARTTEAINVRIVIADSSTVTALFNYRHNYVGSETWATATMDLLGSMGGDFKMYGCTIPASVVGTVVVGATGRLNIYGRIIDQFGLVTTIDSRGVTVNETVFTDTTERAGGYHAFSAADSVYVQPMINTDSRVTRGLGYRNAAWGETLAMSGDTILIKANTYADTIVFFVDGVWKGSYDTTNQGNWTTPAFAHVLHAGVNQISLWGYDDTEPSRQGDTFYVYCDTVAPMVTGGSIETGSVAIDSGVNPTLTVQVTGTDPYGLSGTPDYLVLADTSWANALNRLADEDTTVLGTLRVVRVPYTGLASYPWSGADTTMYAIYAFVIDRAGNVSQVTVYDTVAHDTKGPQITFAGVSDPQGCSYPVNLAFSTYDISTVSEVRLFYRHDSAGVAYWAETVAVPAGGNNWTAVIPDSVTGTTPDTGMGVRYFLRATDTMGHISYWGDSDGVMPYANVTWNDTDVYDTVAGVNMANRDAVAKTNYYYDTFGVVTGVATTVTVSDSYGSDSLPIMSLVSGYYFDSSAIWVRVNTQGVADSTVVKNVTTGVTITTYGNNNADTNVFLPLKFGANSLQVYAYDTQLPATTLNYTVYADTDVPQLIDGLMFGRIYWNPATDREYTDSTGFYLAATVTDTTSSVAQYRIGEDIAFITGRDTSWQTYAASVGYVPLAQDTVVFYVQFRDPAGNMTTAQGPVNLFVDTQGPLVALNAAVADSRAANDTLNLSLTIRDESGDTLLSNVRGWIWYSNPNQYAGGVGGWDSQAIIYNGAGYTWSCSIPAAVIGPLPDSSVAWFVESFDTWGKASYLVGTGGTGTLNYTETMTLAQAKTLADTFTTISAVAVQTWIRDSNDTLAGQVLISNGKVVNSDTLYLRFITDADSISVRINNILAGDTAFGYDSYSASDTVIVVAGFLRPGINLVNISGRDYSMPAYSDTFVVFCDTVAPNVALANLALADNDRSNYVAADTLALRAWFTARDTTSAVGAYRWSATAPISSGWLSFASPALALSETVNITLSSGGTMLTVYVQVQDTAGNISDTFIDTILYDTQAPLIYYGGVQDSQAAAAPVTVLPLFYDLSGTTALTAYLYVKHDPDTSTWLLLNMSPTGASGSDTSYFTANIPDTVVGHADTTAPMTAYVIAVKDWFDQWRYYGYNGDSSFALLALAQAAPDSFTTVWSIAVTVQIIDIDSLAVSLADGIYVNSTICTVHISSPGADTIQLGRYASNGTLLDTKSYYNATANPDTWIVIDMVYDTNYLVVYVQDTVVAGQPQPAFWRKYTITADTVAPVLVSFNWLGRQYTNPVNARNYTDSGGIYVATVFLDSTGVSQYRVGEDAAFVTGTDTSWQNYATTIGYTFKKQDTVPLFFQFRDMAGNVTAGNDTVYMDTQGPQSLLVSVIMDSRAANDTLSFTVTLRDESGDTTLSNTRGFIWYSNPNQYAGGVGGWDSQAIIYSGTGVTWSCSIPAAVIGPLPDSSVAWFVESFDTWGKASYLVGTGGTGTLSYTETMTLAQAKLLADTFTTISAVAVQTWIRDSNDTLAGQVLISNGKVVNSDTLYLRFITDADSIFVRINNILAGDTAFGYDSYSASDTVIVLAGFLRPGINLVNISGRDYSMPAYSDTFVVFCDTVAPNVALANLALADNDRSNYVAADTLALRAWFTARDTTSAVGAYRWSATAPISSGWLSFASPALALSETVNITLSSGTTVLTVYVQVQDTAGNISDTFIDTILYDTQAPLIYYGGVQDSQAAAAPVTVLPLFYDLSGTTALTAYLYVKHDPDTSTWLLLNMSPTGASGSDTSYFTANIPDTVVGHADTTAPMNAYVIAVKDWFDQWRYYGYNGDSSFASLALAQAAPDSFTTVWSIAVTAQIIDVDTTTLADGIYVNSTICVVHINAPGADTIQLGRYTQSGTLLDTKSYYNATADPETWIVISMVYDTNYLVVYVQDTVVAGTPQPASWRKYMIFADTYAPYSAGSDTARIHHGMATIDRLNLTLNLDASDSDNGNYIIGGVRYMQFAEDAAFTINATAGTIPYATSYNYTCTGAYYNDSVITVHMRFYDFAGNVSTAAISDTIYYDTAAPLIVFTPISDSRQVNRPVTVTATVTDLSDTPLSVTLVAWHISGTWDSVAMTWTAANTYTGSIPASIIGNSSDPSPGVLYYLVATDSWGHQGYWADSRALSTRSCTTLALARQYADTFSVAQAVSTSVSAADRDSSTYAAMNVWPTGWTPQYYRSDSFAIRVVTSADSLALYSVNRATLVATRITDTVSLTWGATGQAVVFNLSDSMVSDTMLIMVYAFDYTEPANTETYAIIADTTAPLFTAGPLIDAGLTSSGDSDLAITLTGADSYTVAYMIISETHPMDMLDTASRRVAYSTSATYTLTRNAMTLATIYVALIDTAGNYVYSSDSILYDTQAPQFVFAGVADSQSANQNVAVRPVITDLNGTTTLTVTLYYRHPLDTATWTSSAMTALPDGTFLGNIPASVVGVDTVNRVEYVIAATDTHNRTRYYGANGDTSFATLVAAQAKPDSFTIVTPIATTVRIWDADDAAWQVMANGLVFNNATLKLAVAPDTSVADSITIWVRNIRPDLSGTDSLVFNGYIPMLVAGYDTFTIPMLVTYDYCTYIVRVIVRDTAGVVPNYDNQWTIVCDTLPPSSGVARIGSNPATDTFIGTVSQSVIFTAQDSYGVSTVYHYGNVTTTGTAAYTAAAQTVTFSAGEGWKNLFHYYKDAAGNISAVFGDSFYLDITSGTVTVSPMVLSTTVAAYTCTGSVVDNGIETPAVVSFKLNGVDTGTAVVNQISGNFTRGLILAKGVNTIRVTATDSSGNSSSDQILVTYADVAPTVTGTSSGTIAVTPLAEAGGIAVVNFGTCTTVTMTYVNAARTETVTATVSFVLSGYTVATTWIDSATAASVYGNAGVLNGITTTNFGYGDTLIFRFDVTDSQGGAVTSASAYNSVYLEFHYSGIPAADEPNLDIFIFDETDSRWKKATEVAGLAAAGATEQQSLTADTIALRVTHLSTWGVFVGGVAVAANLNNVVIFPNPFKPYDGLASTGEPYNGNPNSMTGIHFTNLAASTEIKIYTTNGELVAEATSAANDGMAVWDARNKGGEEVASGIYLVVFKQGGQVVVKKLAIIR